MFILEDDKFTGLTGGYGCVLREVGNEGEIEIDFELEDEGKLATFSIENPRGEIFDMELTDTEHPSFPRWTNALGGDPLLPGGCGLG